MKQKLLSMVILAAMVFALGVPASASASDGNVVFTYGFDGNERVGALNEGAVVVTDGTPQSGDGYASLPGTASNYAMTFEVPEGGDKANYILSFYAKTSVGENLFVETKPQVVVRVDDKTVSRMDWSTYRTQNSLPCAGGGEGKSYLYTGLATEDGGEWMKNSLEFYVPEGCDLMYIQIGAAFITGSMNTLSFKHSLEDAHRAIDSITIEKAELNLLRNGNFECVAYKADGTKIMPYASWYQAGTAVIKTEEAGNQYLFMSDSVANNAKEGYVSQDVYLYPGEYRFSMDASMTNSRGAQIISFEKGSDADGNALTGSDCNILRNQQLALMAADKNKADRARSYSTYFTVNTAGCYNFIIGNGYYTGEFTFDNVKMVPVEKAHLQFGTVTHSATDTNEGDAGDFHFEYIPAKALEAGDTVKAFGYGVTAAAGDAAQIITAVYKISESGQRVLAELKIDNAEAGKLFAGTDITIPTTEAGESLEIKAMVLDSVAGLKPLGDTFILE